MSRSKGKSEILQADVLACMHNMSMKQLKDPNNGIFLKMPKSILIHGRKIPRTALRHEDLARLYLQLGGVISVKKKPVLKHFIASKKAGPDQRRYEQLMEQRTKDHNGKPVAKHASSSSKTPHLVALSNAQHSASFSKQKQPIRSASLPRDSSLRKNSSLKKRDFQSSMSAFVPTSVGKKKDQVPLRVGTKKDQQLSSVKRSSLQKDSTDEILKQMRRLKVSDESQLKRQKKNHSKPLDSKSEINIESSSEEEEEHVSSSEDENADDDINALL